MNKDILKGKWMQIRGEAKKWWGELTDDELDKVSGEYDKFVGLIQEKYGYARDRAEKEVDRRLDEYDRTQTVRR
jgi:uncharacterized protein YjbJ (UPF0337 family)